MRRAKGRSARAIPPPVVLLPEEDSLEWEEHADQTVRAIPVAIPWREIKP